MGAVGPRDACRWLSGVPACCLQPLPEWPTPGRASPATHPAAQVLLLDFAHTWITVNRLKLPRIKGWGYNPGFANNLLDDFSLYFFIKGEREKENLFFFFKLHPRPLWDKRCHWESLATMLISHECWDEQKLVHDRTHVRKLIGRILATSVFLQASFFIGAQDFGRRAMPFGFCHTEREALKI